MVKLNANLLQYLEEEDFRVLAALEMAMRNHELIPVPLVERIANLPRGGAGNRLREMLKYKLIHHDRTLYDGYAMKYAAYDYLALHVFSRRGVLSGIGNMVGMGKEADVYLGCDQDGNHLIVKLERLGRCSFRSVARNRDYTKSGKRGGASWFYLSRLAATKEFAFMNALYEEGFPVPKPIDHNRHAIVMERIKGLLLANWEGQLKNPSRVFHQCMDFIVRLAQNGLIHGDFNEFNIMIKTESEDVVVIDFPQMISTSHLNATDHFDRDVKCIHDYFMRKYKLSFDYRPTLSGEGKRTGDLDARVAKTKFTETQQRDMEKMVRENAQVEDAETNDEEAVVPSEVRPPRHVDATAALPDDDEDAVSVPTTTANRPNVIAIIAEPTIDVKRIRTRLTRENERKSITDLKSRTMHRNQFKTKDKRALKGEMKLMKDIQSEM